MHKYEKNILYIHAMKKVKKGTYIEIQNDFQNMFKFYDSLYGLWIKGLYWCSSCRQRSKSKNAQQCAKNVQISSAVKN